MNASSGPRRADDDPSVGRASLLAAVLEEVVAEVDGDVVILQQLLALLMLQKKSYNC